ncbi:MAG: polyprenol monophosphomannose synthase [Patescibacteria group bacterium]|nr:polyprenol monophosphomannose synthase [Patescibacteria group bacterium]
MSTTIVIPTYNEALNIDELINRIFSQNIPNLNIIFVDDASGDGTAEKIKEWGKKYPIILVSRPAKLGIGSAYIAGFKQALTTDAEYILEMDADLSHAPEDIPRLLAACAGGADLVIGSRKVPGGGIVGWNWWRHFISNAAMFTACLALGLKTRDVTAGFRCYKRQTLEKIDLEKIKSNGYAFQEEMVYRVERLGFKVAEVPVIFNDRRRGVSKLSSKDAMEFFAVMIKLKF